MLSQGAAVFLCVQVNVLSSPGLANWHLGQPQPRAYYPDAVPDSPKTWCHTLQHQNRLVTGDMKSLMKGVAWKYKAEILSKPWVTVTELSHSTKNSFSVFCVWSSGLHVWSHATLQLQRIPAELPWWSAGPDIHLLCHPAGYDAIVCPGASQGGELRKMLWFCQITDPGHERLPSACNDYLDLGLIWV